MTRTCTSCGQQFKTCRHWDDEHQCDPCIIDSLIDPSDLHTRTLPGHPMMAGAGYDCCCGACLALPARRVSA